MSLSETIEHSVEELLRRGHRRKDPMRPVQAYWEIGRLLDGAMHADESVLEASWVQELDVRHPRLQGAASCRRMVDFYRRYPSAPPVWSLGKGACNALDASVIGAPPHLFDLSNMSAWVAHERRPFTYTPPSLPLRSLYEDEDLLAFDKPPGLLSVPGKGPDHHISLQTQVLSEFPEALLLHRLDLATSGVILFARHREAQRHLARSLQLRRTEKVYEAVVEGTLTIESCDIDIPIGSDWERRPAQQPIREGKEARTRLTVIAHEGQTTRVRLEPHSGRTHQLRVHCAAIGHPICGDRIYAPASSVNRHERLLLHARSITLPHPADSIPITLVSRCPF